MGSVSLPTTDRRQLHRWLGLALLMALVALAVFRSYLGTRLDSFTIDEPYHVVAGTSYVRTGDFRLNPEHPPLMKLWLGRSMPESFKLRPFQPLNEKVEERDFTEETVFFDNDAVALQARMRQSLWLFHGLLLLALGLLVWRAVGLACAAGVLAYVAVEPTLMAHAPAAMTDLPLALTLGITVAAAALAITTWGWRWIALFGVAINLSLGSKHSALPGLLGVAVVCALAAAITSWSGGARTIGARLGKLAVAGLIGVLLLWVLYGGHFHAARDGSDPFNRAMSLKVGDLSDGMSKRLIAFADQWHLLPRAYLWGLADTVRTGVEGRGLRHFFFGRWYVGETPTLFWPGVIVTKVPLFLLAFCSLGVIAVWRAPLSREMRWLLLCALGMAGAHLLALASSKGTWGGVRHALPILLAMSFLAAAAVWRAWQARSRWLALACGICWLGTLAMTIREPRLWEYSNELAGGTAGNYRYFMNEGQDLGQRYGEFKNLYDRVIKPSGQRFYSIYWFIEEQAKADGLQYSRFAGELDDQNTEGVFEGYYLLRMADFVPNPSQHWDPATLDGLEKVARFGNATVLRGRFISPLIRAQFLLDGAVLEEIYKKPAPNWTLIAEKLREICAVMPWSENAAILLGNACLNLDGRAESIAAYQHALRAMDKSDPTRPEVERQIARLQSGEALTSIQPIRSRLLE